MTLDKNIISVKNTLPSFNEETLKLKLLSPFELLTSLDRLTRFKYPPVNKNRVYENLITTNLISPKIKLKSINNLRKGSIEKLVEIIWNKSVKAISKKETFNNSLNKYLAFEETKTFSSKKILEELIIRELPDLPDDKAINQLKNILEEEKLIFKENYFELKGLNIYDELYINTRCATMLNISSFVEYLNTQKTKQYPKNVERIIKLWDFIKKKKLKIDTVEDLEYLYKFQIKEKSYNFALPARLLIIAEGNTEEVLLPIFCQKSGFDFQQKGVQLIGAGGKNQVLRIYNDIKNKISIPVFILLDADGVDIKSKLENIIKPKDTFYIIEEGEFEDILKVELICKAINNFYKAEGHISLFEINNNMPKTKILYNIWKEKGFGEFSKSTFAKIIAENIAESEDISEPLMKIIKKIESIPK